MIVEKVLEYKQREIKQSPVNSNRASQLGHECLRYHVFDRTKWNEKTLHNVSLQSVFDLGRDIEDIVLRELREAGFQVHESQRAFSWPEYKITGSIDGMIIIDGEAIPLEIKSSSPYAFKSINSVEDIKKHKYPYMRRYLSQVTLYCLLSNKDRAVIIFKNKVSGELKEIWVPLDYELGESLLRKAEAINAHVEAGTIPDPIPYNEMLCDECPFVHLCLPEHIGKEVEIDTTNLSEMLDRLEELKPIVKEYEEIDDQVKETVKGREKILAGNWFVTGKYYDRKSYDVPAEIKSQYEKVTQYWKTAIKKVAA
jgi:CRISPR/Cas system-associated exonuclease Cas4 (RecB family)